MTKEQLRTQKINEGWDVPVVSKWQLVSAEGLEPKQYDVNDVFDPVEERRTTAQVVVYNESTPEENAVGKNTWEETFDEALTVYLRNMEDTTPNLFAVMRDKVNEIDAAAKVTAIMDEAGKGAPKTFYVKKRNGTFSYIQAA